MANTGTKFTAGPWTLPPRDEVRFEKEIVLIEPAVAIDFDDVDHDEAYANALLIACAPELYEIARQVAEHFEHTDAPLGKQARDILARLES